MSDQQGYNQNWQSQYQHPQQAGYGQPQQPHSASGYVFNNATGQWEMAGYGGQPSQGAIWPGVVSCILGGLAMLCACVMFAGLVSLFSSHPEYVENPDAIDQLDVDDMPPAVLLAGCSLIVGGLAALGGLVFGVIGLIVGHARKGWAIAGTIGNSLLMLGMCCIGIAG